MHFLHGEAEDGHLGKAWESRDPLLLLVEEANNFRPFCPSFSSRCVCPMVSSKVIAFVASGCCCQRIKNSNRNFWGLASVQKLKKFVRT